MFVIDSIPVMDDPEEGNELVQSDVADITVIKNKDTLNRLGFAEYDGVTFIFTKAYRNRPDSLKIIPSSKQMKRENNVWLFRGDPYTGRFIDYYYSGRKQREGTFAAGKPNGVHTMYYQNGRLAVVERYDYGVKNGFHTEYYEDGTISQKGEFKNGKEEGIWEDYYPNGQVKLRGNYHVGEIFDTATRYYSTGRIKEKVFIKNGRVIADARLTKVNRLMARSKESNKMGDTKAAIKFCSKAIEIDSTFAEAYFSRGTLKLNDFQFDEAIVDLDKALQLEPYKEVALANRAFARIRKYKLADARTLSENGDVTVLASPDNAPIPAEEQEKICSDLQKAIQLGNKKQMVMEAVSNYCSDKNSHGSPSD